MDQHIQGALKNKMKPHLPFNTGTSTAYFFFKDGEELELFKDVGISLPRGCFPSFIIYQEILFCRPGFYFVAGDAGKLYFSSTEVLGNKEFKLFCKYLLESCKIFMDAKGAIEDLQKSDHAIDSLTYTRYLKGIESPGDLLEKHLIDLQDISGLERSLQEALQRENYEAAAHIKNRVQEKGFKIFEVDGKLLIRRPSPKTINQNN